jgi:hypothetical protein
VSADPEQLRFYVDESLLGLGKVLALARRDVIHAGHPLIASDVPCGTLDPDWIPQVAARGLTAIVHDKKLRTRPGERDLVIANGLRIIRLENKRDLSTWSMLELLVRKWDRIDELALANGAGPWFMEIRQSDVRMRALVGR